MTRVRLDFMVESRYTVKALDQSTWAVFAALVERNNGIFGGCWCMGFHPKESWTDVAQKRAAKEQRVQEDKAHAALVFDGEDCVGWCQFGAPGEVPGNGAAAPSARDCLHQGGERGFPGP